MGKQKKSEPKESLLFAGMSRAARADAASQLSAALNLFVDSRPSGPAFIRYHLIANRVYRDTKGNRAIGESALKEFAARPVKDNGNPSLGLESLELLEAALRGMGALE